MKSKLSQETKYKFSNYGESAALITRVYERLYNFRSGHISINVADKHTTPEKIN